MRRTPGAADGPPPSRERNLVAPPCREYTAEQDARSQGRWRQRGLQRHHKNLTPMRTPGAADGPPPNREWPLDALPCREYAADQVAYGQGRWRLKGH